MKMASLPRHHGVITHDVYVTNLSVDANEDNIGRIFQRYGKYHSISLEKNYKRPNSLVATISFYEQREAFYACSEMNGKLVEGRKLFVNMRRQDSDYVDHSMGDGRDSVMNNNVVGEGILLVTHCDGPCTFWAQMMSQEKTEELLRITEALLHMNINTCKSVQGPPRFDRVYAAVFSEDDMLYRCKVLSHHSMEKSLVQYIDYGNREVVSNSSIVELSPQWSLLPSHAAKYCLYGLTAACQDSDSERYTKGTSYLKSQTDGQYLQCQMYPQQDGITPVKVNINGVDINAEVLRQGFVIETVPAKTAPSALPALPPPRGDGAKGGPPCGDGGSGGPPRGDGAKGGSQYVDGARGGPSCGDGGSGGPPRGDGGRGGPPYGDGTRGRPPYGDGGRGGPPYGDGARSRPPCGDGGRGGPPYGDGARGRPPYGDGSRGGPPYGDGARGGPLRVDSGRGGPPHDGARGPSHGDGDRGGPTVLSHTEQQQQYIFPSHPSQTLSCPSDKDSTDSVVPVERVPRSDASSSVKIKELENTLTAVTAERDAALLELSRVKGKGKVLQLELDSLTVKLAETNISHKMKNLVEGIRRVKLFRSQFPTDDHTDDLIELAIGLITDHNNKITVTDSTMITMVKEVEAQYRACQAVIKDCKHKEELPALVSQRDESRVELHRKLTAFLENTSKLPLQEREEELMNILSKLQATYGDFLREKLSKLPGFTRAVEVYRDWRAKKKATVSDMRTATNTCHNSVSSAFQMLQQQLELDSSLSSECPSGLVNLDTLLSRLEHRIGEEIKISDWEHSPDATVVSTILQTLLAAVEEEKKDIAKLREMKSYYSKLLYDIEPWLLNKPSVEELTRVRKMIKALKSRLRHKIADLHDLEDSDESQRDELPTLHKELAELRQQLHQALTEEQEELGADQGRLLGLRKTAILADLSKNSFPELNLEYPEFGIKNYVDYDGLVLLGCDTTHFDMVAVKDSATVFKTTFCGRDVVLREYIVGSHGGGSQEEFLKKAKDYKALGSGRLVPLEAIFFQKNGCQCFARTPYYKLNAGGLSAKGEASTEAFYKILYGALEGLSVLHGAGLVHGALHPENVFIGEDGYGVLDFSWSLTPEQRAGTVKTFSNGLKFCPPEMKPGDSPTMQGDLYCFGLLILWLHFPEVNMSAVDSDGVQYIPAYGVTPTLKLVLEAVLQRNPAQRATAERLLQSDFFTETPLVNSEEFEPETLQLRPRGLSPSPTSQGKGILKNGTAKLQRPEVAETKMWKSDIDVTAIPLPVESDSQESFTDQIDTEQISFKSVDIKTEENRAADGGDVTPTGDLDIFPTKMAHRN